MYDKKERIRRVRQRVIKLQEKRENWMLGGLGVLIVQVTFLLLKLINITSRARSGTMLTGLYGAMLLYEDAGGYVLVVTVSFVIAVIITVLCIRICGKNKNNKDKSDKERED